MTDENRSTDANRPNGEHSVSSIVPGSATHRRRVLQGIGALGLGTAVTGTAQAQSDDDSDEVDADDDEASEADGLQEAPIGIQLWTIRDLGDSVADQVQLVADAGYDAVEFFEIDDPDEISEAVDDAGIEVAGAHVGLEALEEDFEETVETHTRAGVETFVVPAVDEAFWESEDSISDLGNRFNTLADQLEEEGLKFGFHNHEAEFVNEIDDRPVFDYLVEETEDHVYFQIDNLTAVGGRNPVEQIYELGERVDSTHSRDLHRDVPEEEAAYDHDGVTWDFAEVGEGDIPIGATTVLAQVVGDADWVIYEHEPEDPEASLETGYEVLSERASLDVE